MAEENGIVASRMHAERMSKDRTPIEENRDWPKELEKFRKKYGRRLDPEEIHRLLHGRFGE